MNFCCDSQLFGGIGIGRMSDFCQMTGVEAPMVPCQCRRQCGGCRQQHRHDDRDTCGYTTTGDREPRNSGCGCG